MHRKIPDSLYKSPDGQMADNSDVAANKAKEIFSEDGITNFRERLNSLIGKISLDFEKKKDINLLLSTMFNILKEVYLPFEGFASDKLDENIRRFQRLLPEDQIENIKLLHSPSSSSVDVISNKIKKSLKGDSNSLYILNSEGSRGDHFIADLYSLFIGIEKSYSEDVANKLISSDQLKKYHKLTYDIEAYIRTQLGFYTDVNPRDFDIKKQLGQLGFYDHGYHDRVIFSDYMSFNIETSDFMKIILRLHSGDVGRESIGLLMIYKIYDLIERGKIKKAKKNLDVLVYHLLDHQKIIARQAVSYIDNGDLRLATLNSKTVYEIDRENSSDSLAITKRLVYLYTRILQNRAVVEQVYRLLNV